jgi:hypothetical protein
MDLEQRLLREHSRRNAEQIASWVGGDTRRFHGLMRIFLRGGPLLAQRSAWVVSICAESHPALIPPYLRRMIARMLEPGMHDAVRRAVVRILQTVEIPPPLLGRVASVCFDQLSSAGAGVAVKVFAMTVLGRIAEGRPDLARELRIVIEQQLPFASAGFAARARMILKTPFTKISPR